MATASTRRRRRKAFIKFIIIVVMLIIIFLIFRGCGNSKKQEKQDSVEKLNEEISTLEDRKDELTTQLEELESELASIKVEIANAEQIKDTNANQLISEIFWSDGNIYKDTNEVEFYVEPGCETSLGNDLKFTSPVVLSDIERKNGQKINIAFSEKGIVFSVDEPDLDIYVDSSEKG